MWLVTSDCRIQTLIVVTCVCQRPVLFIPDMTSNLSDFFSPIPQNVLRRKPLSYINIHINAERWSFSSPTFRCDSEHSVWWWRPVNIGGVSDRARVGSIIVQRCVYQRDGSVAASRGTPPPDTAKELTRRGEENPWGEVEKLERDEIKKNI